MSLLNEFVTSSVLWLRHNPAPPNEEQFNASTTGDRTRHNARLLAVGNMYCFIVFGDLWVFCGYCGVWSIGLICSKILGSPWAFLCLILILLSPFCRSKRSKNARHAQKSVTTAFCSRVASDILRSAVVLRKQLFVQPSGTKELAFHAITATGWTPLKQHLSYSAAWTAVCCDFIGAGSLFRITYACCLRNDKQR